jgi:hypothetical protein
MVSPPVRLTWQKDSTFCDVDGWPTCGLNKKLYFSKKSQIVTTPPCMCRRRPLESSTRRTSTSNTPGPPASSDAGMGCSGRSGVAPAASPTRRPGWLQRLLQRRSGGSSSSAGVGCSGRGGVAPAATGRGGGDSGSDQTRGWRRRLWPWCAVVVWWVGKKLCII